MKRKIDEWNLFHTFSKNGDHFFLLNLKLLNFFNLKWKSGCKCVNKPTYMCFLFHVGIFMADIYMFIIHYFFYIDHSKAILIKKVKISIFVIKILWK